MSGYVKQPSFSANPAPLCANSGFAAANQEQPTNPSPSSIPGTFSGGYESPDSERESPIRVSTPLTLADMPTPLLQAVPEDIMLPKPNHKVPKIPRSVPAQNNIQALPTPVRYQRYDYATKLSIAPWRRSSSLRLWYMSFEAKARGANLPLEEAVHLHQIFSINSSRKTKHMRWKVYIYRLKTIDQVCKSMLGDDPANTVIAYGSGKFNSSSPGYKSSPTRASRFENRLRKVHNATVLKIWEFNTSQVCSQCHAHVKMCGVATQQDPFMAPANIVGNHQLRQNNHGRSGTAKGNTLNQVQEFTG